MASGTLLVPPAILTRAWFTSGYCVDEWLPQMVQPWTAEGGTRRRMAIWDWERLASRRVRAVKLPLGMEGAHCCATQQLVLAGLPTCGKGEG